MLLRLFLLTSVFCVTIPVVDFLTLDDHKIHTIGATLADSPTLITVFQFSLLLGIFVSWITGEDLNDRIINYEVMQGHARWKCFFTRALSATILGALGAVFQSMISILIPALIFGWGDTIPLGEMLFRTLLCFFPAARTAAFLVLMTFLFKNKYLGMASGVVMTLVIALMNDLVTVGERWTFVAGFQNIMELLSFTGWNIYNLDPARGVVTYSAYSIRQPLFFRLETVGISLLMVAVYLFAAFVVFRREDLK